MASSLPSVLASTPHPTSAVEQSAKSTQSLRESGGLEDRVEDPIVAAPESSAGSFRNPLPPPSLARTDSVGRAPAKTEPVQGVTVSQAGKTLRNMVDGPNYFIMAGEDGVPGALQQLDSILRKQRKGGIISDKTPVAVGSNSVRQDEIGLYTYNGKPRVITRAGNYVWAGALGSWANPPTRRWAEPLIEHAGLTILNVGPNCAAVVLDPDHNVSIMEEGGFVSYGAHKVLKIVNKNELSNPIKAPDGEEIGRIEYVMNESSLAATFIYVESGNVAIMQRGGGELVPLRQGHHHIVGHEETFRTALSLRENQRVIPKKKVTTRDLVDVSISLNLRWRLVDPMTFLTTAFKDPFDALHADAQAILNKVVGNLNYAQFMKQRALGKDDGEDDQVDSFLDQIMDRCKRQLVVIAEKKGILLEDCSIQERSFDGGVADSVNNISIQSLESQAQAATLQRQNDNRILKAQGDVKVANFEAQAAMATQKVAAEVAAYAILQQAQARADARRLEAAAEAEAISLVAAADAAVPQGFARDMALQRVRVQQIGAWGNKAIVLGLNDAVGTGLSFGLGNQLAATLRDDQSVTPAAAAAGQAAAPQNSAPR